MPPLTAKQQLVFNFIVEFITANGFPPTQAEIAQGLGFRSANAAAEHLRLMAKKGVLSLRPGVARGLQINSEPPQSPSPWTAPQAPHEDSLAIIGQVAAGRPILAHEQVEAHLPISPRAFQPRADYLLRVRGDSMIEAGIQPGDLLAVHRQQEVPNGRIAVIRIDDEVTVKYWYRNADHVLLKPANAEHSPKRLSLDSPIALEGLVVGLLRFGLHKDLSSPNPYHS